MERSRAGRSPADPGRRPVNDLTSTANMITAQLRNNFTDEDNKSKNILAWAGRVKELIGTFDPGNEASVVQLTRATGYSDLLAACRVDSGDVTSKASGSKLKTGQTSSTSFDQPIGLPKPHASPLVTRLVAEKDDAEKPAAVYSKESTRPLSPVSTMSLAEDRSRQTDRRQSRRTSSSQGRARPHLGLGDASPKPAARRASHTEATPPAAGDGSQAADTRTPARKSSVGQKLNSTTERTSAVETNRNGPSRDTGADGQRSPRARRLSVRNSKEKLPAAPKASINKNQPNDKIEMYSNQEKQAEVRHDRKGAAFGKVMSSSSSNKRSTATAQNNIAEDRNDSPANEVRTSDLDDAESADDKDEVVDLSQDRVCTTAGNRGRDSRSYDVPHANNVEMPYHMDRDGDFEDNKSQSDFDVEEDNSESLFQPDSDLQIERRASPQYASTRLQRAQRARPSPQRITDTSPPTDVEPKQSLSCRPRTRDSESNQRRSRPPPAVDANDKESLGSLCKRLSDLSARRRTEYAQPANVQRALLPPQRIPEPDRSTAADSGRQRQDLSGSREQATPVKSRKRLASDGGGGRPRQEEREDGAASMPKSTARPRRTASQSPGPPRPILRRKSPQPSIEELATAIERGKSAEMNASSLSYQRRPASLSPENRARPAVMPPRSTPAAMDLDDLDDDDRDIVPRYTEHRLSNLPDLTDLCADNRVVGQSDPQLYPRTLTEPAPPSPSTTPSTSLTPRRVWEFMRLRQLLRTVLDFTKRMLNELFCLPPVARLGKKMRESCMCVMDDWAMFSAVIFTVSCVLIAIVLC